jgi:membrane protease YdiL (CAAX protease family)
VAIVFLYGAVVVLGGLLSTWAHLGNRRRLAKGALIAFLGLISLGLVVGGFSLFGGSGDRRDTGWVMVAVGTAVGLPLLPFVRAAVARLTPVNPESIPDTVGLCLLLGLATYSGGTSIVTTEFETSPVSTTELVSQAIALVAIAYLGVGFLINRDFRDATRRVGLRRLSMRDAAAAVALVLVAFGISIAASVLTTTFQPGLEQEIERRTLDLTANVSSLPGALTLGISAGVGEEILFRGAILPRYGLVLTSVVFALVHVQYGISLTALGILGIGFLFGWERIRFNTTAAIITHVVYDVIVVLLSAAGTTR